jgi:hypothetical protein
MPRFRKRGTMPSSVRGYALAAVRVVLVGGGGLVGLGVLVGLATMPPPPPGSDGFVSGLAYIFGGAIAVFALGAAALGVALPTLLGTDDRLGFGRFQRLALKAAGALFGGGLLVGLAFGLATEMQFGVFVWLVAILLSIVVVVATVGWRLGEVVVTAASRRLSDG